MTIYIIIGAFALSIYLIFFRWPKKAATEPEPFQPRIQSTVHPKNCQDIKYPGYNGKKL